MNSFIECKLQFNFYFKLSFKNSNILTYFYFSKIKDKSITLIMITTINDIQNLYYKLYHKK